MQVWSGLVRSVCDTAFLWFMHKLASPVVRAWGPVWGLFGQKKQHFVCENHLGGLETSGFPVQTTKHGKYRLPAHWWFILSPAPWKDILDLWLHRAMGNFPVACRGALLSFVVVMNKIR